MVRLAQITDAEQLEMLNIEFNGEGETNLEHIKDSLLNNRQEIVIVDEENGRLSGFACIQLKRSFCYDDYMPEITEVFVRPEYRRRGIASAVLAFAEELLKKQCPAHKIELLTGGENTAARKLYENMGFIDDGELHMSKAMIT